MNLTLLYLLIAVVICIGVGTILVAYGITHLPVVDVPNNVTLGEGIRVYLVNTVLSVPVQNPFNVGDQMDFRWAIQNTGTIPLTNVVVHSELNPGTSNFVSDDCTIEGNLVTCLSPNLAPGERYGFFSFFVTIEPELVGTLFRSEGKVCGESEGVVYCATDRSIAVIEPLVDPIPDPEPPVVTDPIVLQVNVTALNERIIQFENKVVELEVRVEQLQTQITTLTNTSPEPVDLTNLENRLGILEQSWSNFVTAWRSVFG